MFGNNPQKSVDELMGKVAMGNMADSTLQAMGSYIDEVVQRLTSQWINTDVAQFHADASLINFHEAYRQAIRTHLLLKTQMQRKKVEGKSAGETLGLTK